MHEIISMISAHGPALVILSLGFSAPRAGDFIVKMSQEVRQWTQLIWDHKDADKK